MTRLYKSSIVPALALLILLAAGCSTRQANLSTLGPDDLYARATEAYEARNWDQAVRILEFFVTEHIGDPRAADARMMLGDLHSERREYATAATQYQRLVLDFPSDPRALEARFKMCSSYHSLSPRPTHDQEYTVVALSHCESVRDNYPGTDYAAEAAALIVELRGKLARKAYENGVFYFRRNAFDAAVVYFEEVLSEFPDSEIAPAAMSQLVETFERIGYVEDAIEMRERLLREYPESPEAQSLAAG